MKRVYLCGQLNKVNDFDHIENDGLEIGISRYQVFTADLPHLIAFGCHTAEEHAKRKKAIKNVLLFGSIFYIIHLVVIILLIAYLQALLF